MDYDQDIDDDFELSNRVVNDYLNQFEEFSNLRNEGEKSDQCDLNNIKNKDEFNLSTENDSKNEISQNKLDPFKLSFLIDQHKISKILSKDPNLTNQVLLKEDIKQIFDCYTISGTTFNGNILSFLKYILTDVIWIAIFLLLFLFFVFVSDYFNIVNFIYCYIFAVIAFVFLLLFQFKFFDHILYKLLKSTHEYIKTLNNLIRYLKEIEYTSLSNKRQYFFENKKSIDDIITDQLNYPYRKLVFKKLRNDFFGFKSNNNIYLENYKPTLIDKSNLICTIQNDELADALSIECDDENINKSTDYFSINCIRSVNKLNHILLSEQIKLIFQIYVNFISSSKNLLNVVIFWFKFHSSLLKALYLIKKLNNDSIALTNVCQLIKETDAENTKPFFNNKNQDESNLANHLRNAILNLNELVKISTDMKEEKLKYFNMLKSNMDYCDLYFKQLKIKIEGTNCNKSNNDINNFLSKEDLNLIDSNSSDENKRLNEELTPQVVVDEIYEADTYNYDKIFKQTEEDVEISLKEKKSNMVNKNLMYELKYALKSKKNEWKMREKNAKRTIEENSKTVLEEYKSLKNFETDDDDTKRFDNDYLLDNETLKYKSELRKRRNLYAKENKEFKCQKKYSYLVYEKDKENTINDDQKINSNSFSFLSELINKRNDLFKNTRNENEGLNEDEEIIS